MLIIKKKVFEPVCKVFIDQPLGFVQQGKVKKTTILKKKKKTLWTEISTSKPYRCIFCQKKKKSLSKVLYFKRNMFWKC